MLSTISSSTDAATSCRLQNCLNGDNAVPREEVPRDSLSSLPGLSVYGVLLRTRLTLTVVSVYCGHCDSVPLMSKITMTPRLMDEVAYVPV